MPHAGAEAKKAEGNAAFKAGNHTDAIVFYQAAIDLDATNHTYFSNRAAALTALNRFEEAAADARSCIAVKKDFIKGYHRLAVALQKCKDYQAAIDACTTGRQIDPKEATLQKIIAECQEAQRLEAVSKLCDAAEAAFANKDYAGACKLAGSAMQKDPKNKRANAIETKSRPKYESGEKNRKAGLSKNELLKEAGDTKYKAADFEGAIKEYTKCLDTMGDKTSTLAIKVYSNRAACFKQISMFDETISDCTMVLELEENNVKALVRRAQAFEACERFKSALQDVKFALNLGQQALGGPTFTQCNQMQHRLSTVIRKLKQGNF